MTEFTDLMPERRRRARSMPLRAEKTDDASP
jgi:hypothetical protein